jgi:predicted  nucleic acid-binding Zn-ribbon protein
MTFQDEYKIEIRILKEKIQKMNDELEHGRKEVVFLKNELVKTRETLFEQVRRYESLRDPGAVVDLRISLQALENSMQKVHREREIQYLHMK